MSRDRGPAAPAPIRFTARVSTIGDTTLVRVPAEASMRLPSRGQVAVHAVIDGHEFATVVEPDGRRGHWIRLDAAVQRGTRLEAGDTAEVTIVLVQEWPEPDVPDDLAAALADAPGMVRDTWDDITPMARWEWVRWVQATRNPDTRHRRVEVSISKLDGGNRRPCCFDLASCTDPTVATSGKLRDPA